ncbi:MAG: pinensin family lanthipeptide [Cyclobacteriaceae bacterium]
MKKKINIEKLSVKSFLTNLKANHSETFKGGHHDPYWDNSGPWRYCPSGACTGVNCGSANPC